MGRVGFFYLKTFPNRLTFVPFCGIMGSVGDGHPPQIGCVVKQSLLALAWQFVGAMIPCPGIVSLATAHPTGVTAKQALEGSFVRQV